MKHHYFFFFFKKKKKIRDTLRVRSAFLFYISRAAVVVNVIMEIVYIYFVQSQFCHLNSSPKKKKTHLDPSNYSWCKNTFLSLIKRKKTDYYHSTRGPKCNPLLRTVCRYIFNKHKCFCASMFFSHKV